MKAILSTGSKEQCLHNTRYPIIPNVTYITVGTPFSVSFIHPLDPHHPDRVLLHHKFLRHRFLRHKFLRLSCKLLNKFLHNPNHKTTIINNNLIRCLIVVLTDILVARVLPILVDPPNMASVACCVFL